MTPDTPAPLLATASKSTTVADAAALPPQGLGQTLRLLREAKTLSVAAVSSRLKFSTRQITALEAEDWTRLPTGVPLRGLVKNYAALLEADTRLMLDLLDASTPHAQPPHRVLGTGLVATPATLFEETSSRSNWGWLLAIALLVLVAIVYIVSRGWLPQAWQTGG